MLCKIYCDKISYQDKIRMWTKYCQTLYLMFFQFFHTLALEKAKKRCMHLLFLTPLAHSPVRTCCECNYQAACSWFFFFAAAQLGDAPLMQGKLLTGLELAEASRSDKVWKELWSSSLSLSDLTLMDCFVVQGAGQVLLSYITIYGMFAQQVPFPSLP